MKIKTFKVEQWMNEFENDALYNLGETCIDSMSLRELLELAGKNPEEFLASLADERMTYGYIEGSPNLLTGIAGLYENITSQQVIPTHGAIGANYQVILSLIEAKDNMVSVMPTYQQHYSIPESIGAEVRPLQLTLENDFLPDLDLLRGLVDEHTKVITINNPNNPSGSWIPLGIMKEIVEIAKSVDAYILSDEVYRGIAENESYMPSIVDLYDKGISVGSMSKIFSLAGLRLGWIATRSSEVLKACWTRRDYDTISCGRLDDLFASIALAHKDAIFKRNRAILNKNRAILDQWVRETEGVHYLKPVAGTTALVYYDKNIPSYELCVRLIKEKGLLFTPGSCFELEGCVRIGYAFDSKTLREGLDKFAEFLKEN
ncbi:aminotransferase [Aminipila butyrica]|uniref:Aminotransferase n=1 Tax=Aminipila butyrica TaxID=433296 RepID=A0A858BT66_9FIRM|nr:aminotransferase [Aminipila butyrica]QIB68757.1 aminotransferase [Aminipila butyrica]